MKKHSTRKAKPITPEPALLRGPRLIIHRGSDGNVYVKTREPNGHGYAYTPVKPADRVQELTETLLKAITERWPEDSTRPGLVLSFVPNIRNPVAQFYGSVCRYDVRCQGNREVVKASYGPDVVTVLRELAKSMAEPDNKARRALQDLVSVPPTLGRAFTCDELLELADSTRGQR